MTLLPAKGMDEYHTHSTLILRQNPILKLINFQYCVSSENPSFYCCVTLLVANYDNGHDAETFGAMSSFHMPGVIRVMFTIVGIHEKASENL